jgi:hypothetical protein
LPELGPEWGPEYEVVLPMREAAHREGERVTTLRFGTSG